MKKKFLLGLLAVVMCFTLVGCGDKNENKKENDSSNNDGTQNGETVKSNWKNADVKEYELEDFNILTNGVPEPESSYKINVITTVYGLSFNLTDENAVNEYLELIKSKGFTYKDEIYGMETYENNTHEITFSGTSITVEIKD